MSKKQTAVQLILSKWNGKMTQDQFAKWLNENQNLLLVMERQQIIDAFVEGVENYNSDEFKNRLKISENYFTETYGE